MKNLSLLLAFLASLILLYLFAPLFKREQRKPIINDLRPSISEVKPHDNRGLSLINSQGVLSEAVLKTREKLLEAAHSGQISRLKIVFEQNEMMPAFSTGPDRDPLPYWRKRSGDGQGREVLSVLSNILTLPASKINEGKPNEMIVWPYLASADLTSLTPEQKVDLLRLLPPDEAKAMEQFGTYLYWRLGIGKDGTLHYFRDGK